MNEEIKKYWEGFPEAPASDTFKWVDKDGYEHMTTVRAWSGASLPEMIERTKEAISKMGAQPQGKLAQAPSAAPVMVQMKDENGTAVVDQDHQPVLEKIEGAKVYTVEGVAHDKTQNGRDVLKVFTVEKEEFISRKYGVNCFHAPAAYKDFKTWPVGGKYAPKDGATHVVIRSPGGDSKYPQVVEFRA